MLWAWLIQSVSLLRMRMEEPSERTFSILLALQVRLCNHISLRAVAAGWADRFMATLRRRPVKVSDSLWQGSLQPCSPSGFCGCLHRVGSVRVLCVHGLKQCVQQESRM